MPIYAQLPEAHRCFGNLRGVAAAALGRWLALPTDTPGGALTPLPLALEAAFATDVTSSLAPKAQVRGPAQELHALAIVSQFLLPLAAAFVTDVTSTLALKAQVC